MNSEILYTQDTSYFLAEVPQKNNYYIILLCLKGNILIKIGHHSFELGPNMISILSPGKIFSTEKPTADLEVIQLHFEQSFLNKSFVREEIVNQLLELNADYPPVYFLEDSFSRVQEKFKSVGNELMMQSAYHLDVVRLITMEILYEYNRACEFCLLGFKKNMNRNYQLTYEFKKLVDKHFTDWKAVADYSSFLGISAKHLAEVVRVETGNTALQIIHERLLLESQYLLKHTTHSIKECAYKLGFGSPSYFTRFFKNNTGLNPNTYRCQP
ncbi:helix-turn-helix domain-containing protein [Chryseobacterium jejuense]|uniref:AraC family transcriptional regulator, transcriptional activator of pobA n=1 Tax=Chryseobacterium jejuense TaxID=445960 RepID=A0A2X2WYZ3_CHRJE|nr:AraC family transcriptional regulator [Chryseobacterium jejuense]SDJ78744.1 AraC family transcriptional regulator, transcriptional activator of pobA [Chryseobacterium jejuense]SQB43481.1 Bacillibactin transport regulator [Chryseobacterium jejuense]